MPVRRVAVAIAVSLFFGLSAPAAPPENVDLEMVTRIRDEAFNRSKAAETLSKLCDGVGPRLTGSPDYRRAAEWARDQMNRDGPRQREDRELRAVRTGLGPGVRLRPDAWRPPWRSSSASRRRGRPAATDRKEGEGGPREARDAGGPRTSGRGSSREDPPPRRPAGASSRARRGTSPATTTKSLAEIWKYEPGGGRYRANPGRARSGCSSSGSSGRMLDEYLRAEKVVAVLEPSRGDYGTIFVQGGGS